jgi:threonine/homoserine/homoserine lactone efflux protein
MDASLLTFLGISAAVIVAPGPDTALTVRNTFLGGRHGGILTAVGVSAGQVVWSVGTSLGLLALLLTSESVFQALKLLGAAYLGYLGVQSLRSAFHGRSPRGSEPPRDARAQLGGLAAFRQGLLNNLANPLNPEGASP